MGPCMSRVKDSKEALSSGRNSKVYFWRVSRRKRGRAQGVQGCSRLREGAEGIGLQPHRSGQREKGRKGVTAQD